VRDTRAGDVLTVVYSGHGSTVRDDDADEGDGRDECLVGADLAPVPDDALRAVLAALPARVGCTVVLDCCHSGTGARLVGPVLRPGARVRLVPASAVRQDARPTPRTVVTAEQVRHVTLAACTPLEVALESPGPDGAVSGDFTRHATHVLATSGRSLTHAGFLRRVLAGFGPERAQTPTLDGPAAARRRTLVSVPRV